MDQFSVAHLNNALNALAEPTSRFFLHDEQFVPDLLLYHLALDVLEQGRAVGHLIESGIGGPAWANRRAAFESMQDMLVLVSIPDEYCRMGSRARIKEIFDTTRLTERRYKADQALGDESGVEHRTPEAIVEEDAADWDQIAPGCGQLLRDTLPIVQVEQRRRMHWSGLSDTQRLDRTAATTGDPTGVAAIWDWLYGVQSL